MLHFSAFPRIVPFLLLLVTTTTKTAVDASSAPVHGVSVAVRSARSVRYHGMQIPLFENIGTEGTGRYFFPPLALLDCDSIQLTTIGSSGETPSATVSPQQSTVLHMTILLWTEEFLATARAQLVPTGAEASTTSVNVELVPLTELTLTWSGQASQWLGADFQRRFQLLGDWRDAQKPRARITFTVTCNQSTDCRSLQTHFGDTDGSAGHLFDLKYRIRCDTQRRLSVPLASRHLLRSPLFQRLSRFAAKSAGIVLTPEATIEQLATELRAAALDEQERKLGEQKASSVDAAALAALSADAVRLLRQDPVTGAGQSQWADRVFWQQPTSSGSDMSGSGLRPDRLAGLLNRLLSPEASGRPRLVRPVPKATELLAELAEEGDLSPAALNSIRRFLASRMGTDTEPIEVDEVRELAANLGSAVAWDVPTVRFVPSPSVQLYRLDTGRLQRVGIFAVRDVVLQYRVSEQRDHVTPLCRAVHGSADYTEKSWLAQTELLRMRLQSIQSRAQNVTAELRRVKTELADRMVRSVSEVSQRSSHSKMGPSIAETAEARSATEALRLRIQALSDSVSGLIEGAAAPLQKRFADSFCVLANTGQELRGMTCRTISFVMPKASLQSGWADRNARISLGAIGQNLLESAGEKFYKLQLRGCCK